MAQHKYKCEHENCNSKETNEYFNQWIMPEDDEYDEYDGWDYYPADWYDANSPISKLEPMDTPRSIYIGEGSQQYELSLEELHLLTDMRNIFLFDWRENDDDDKTAGWRYEGYYDINGETFDKLISAGLVETQPSAAQQRYVRISKAGMEAIK